MNGKLMLYIEHSGQSHIFARNVRELQRLAGGGRVSKQYINDIEGNTFHTGYVIGNKWFTAYIPFKELVI